RGGETLRRDAFRRIHGPGEREAQDRDAHRDALEQEVLERDAEQREGGFGPLEENEVPEALHRVREEAGDQCESGEDHERYRHDRRRLVRMLVAAVLPAERHEPQTERVERGQERGADAEGPEQVEAGVQGARIEGDRQDLALREESAEGYDAGEGERAEEHDLRGDG